MMILSHSRVTTAPRRAVHVDNGLVPSQTTTKPRRGERVFKGRTRRPRMKQPAYNKPPKKPRSSYDFFFKEEREVIVKGGKKKGNKVSFEEIGKIIGQRWKNIHSDRVAKYVDLASKDTDRYKTEMQEYNGRQKVVTMRNNEAVKSPTVSYYTVPASTTDGSPASIPVDRRGATAYPDNIRGVGYYEREISADAWKGETKLETTSTATVVRQNPFAMANATMTHIKGIKHTNKSLLRGFIANDQFSFMTPSTSTQTQTTGKCAVYTGMSLTSDKNPNDMSSSGIGIATMSTTTGVGTRAYSNTGTKNPIIVTTTTIATVTVTPPSIKIAVEESCDDDIVENKDAPIRVESSISIPALLPMERKFYYEIQPTVPAPLLSSAQIDFLRRKFFKEHKDTKLKNPPDNFFRMKYHKEQKEKQARQQQEKHNNQALY